MPSADGTAIESGGGEGDLRSSRSRLPDPAGARQRLIQFVADRPGHDFRYEIDPSRTEAALDWKAPHDFETGLGRTIDWYLENRSWWEGVRASARPVIGWEPRHDREHEGWGMKGLGMKGILLAGVPVHDCTR